jgi:hypothetical protein
LLREHLVSRWLANALFYSGFLVGIVCIKTGVFSNDDWRGVALCLGAATTLSFLSLPASAIVLQRSPREAIVAYAISQGLPLPLLYAVYMVAFAAFCGGVAAMFF